jgi:hypothetical protein
MVTRLGKDDRFEGMMSHRTGKGVRAVFLFTGLLFGYNQTELKGLSRKKEK